MNSTSPPVPVTASPVATPGTAVRSADSGRNRGRPRKSLRLSVSTATAVASVDASRVATLRSTLAIARSSCRTPASRVYSPAIWRSASSETVTSSSRSAARDSCRGSRCVRAMATLSSSV